MTTLKFTLDNQVLFEKLMKIFHESKVEYRSDFEMIELVMKEVEKWAKEKYNGQKMVKVPISYGVMCVFATNGLRQGGNIFYPY